MFYALITNLIQLRKLAITFLSIFVVFTTGVVSCKPPQSGFGKALVVSLDSRLYFKGQNKYFYSEYPASHFFISTYLSGLLAQLNERKDITGLELSTLGKDNISWLETAFLEGNNGFPLFAGQIDSRYTYLEDDMILLQHFSTQELKKLFLKLDKTVDTNVQHFIAIDILYSVVDQKLKQRMRIFDRQGSCVYTVNVSWVSKYIIYDKASPYLVIDDYLYKQPAAGAPLEEVQQVARDLSAGVVEKLLKKIRKQT